MSKKTPNMTLLTTSSVYVKPLGKKWKREYWFNSKTSLIRSDLPSAYSLAFPEDDCFVDGKSIEEVDKFWAKRVEAWEKSTIKLRKVILYRFALRLHEYDETGRPKGTQRNDFQSGFDEPPVVVIGFEYEVGFEKSVAAVKEDLYYYRPDDDDPSKPSQHNVHIRKPDESSFDRITGTKVVDWTEARERLFETLQGTMVKLIHQIEIMEESLSDTAHMDMIADSVTKSLAQGKEPMVNLTMGKS